MRQGGVIDLPAGNSSKAPIVVLPGFGEGRWGFGPLVRALHTRTGRRTLFVSSPRWGDCERRPEIPFPLVRLARNAEHQLEQREIKGATGIFHSMGGATGVVTAWRNLELFERIILVCSAGHLPNERFWRLAWAVARKTLRCLADSVRGHQRRANFIGLVEAGLYIGANPWRALREAVAARYYTRHLIQRLHEALPPIEVWLVLAEDDVVYSLAAIQEATKTLIPPERVIVMPGLHDLQNDPAALVEVLAGKNLI